MKALHKLFFVMLFLLVAIGSAIASQVFIEGKVTRAPWKDRHYRIEVDNIPYLIMPDVAVWLDSKGRNYMPKKTTEKLHSLTKGTKVWISIQGNSVYQIWEEK